jgi:hypothetical protein
VDRGWKRMPVRVVNQGLKPADRRSVRRTLGFAAAAGFVHGPNPRLPDLALEGATDAASAVDQIVPYAGLTWWIEALGWCPGGLANAGPRIEAGPPR